MIISFIGPKEPNNTFKRKVAEKFKTNIFQFQDLTTQLLNATVSIFDKTSQFPRLVENDIVWRDNLHSVSNTLYTDFISKNLVNKIFRLEENSMKKLQAVVLDVHNDYEYRFLKTFMLSPKNRRTNKFIFIENESLNDKPYNKEWLEKCNSLEFDALISKEDEDDLDIIVPGIIKSWDLTPEKTETNRYIQTM